MFNKIIDKNQTLLIDNKDIDAYSRIINNLENCDEFKFNVAFIIYSGVQILLDKLKELESKNIKGRIITTNYMNTTEVDAIKKLLNFKNIELRIYDSSDKAIGLHAKTYIFKKKSTSKVIVGSSNITNNGLRINCEWNIEMEYDNHSTSFLQIEDEFENLWEVSKEFDEKLFTKNEFKIVEIRKNIVRNHLQEKALLELKRLRQQGQNKALVVAATGTGKTYLSAFDVEQYKPKRLLFLCHRWEIINSVINSFQKIFPNKKLEKFTNKLYFNDSFVFSTIQTMSRKYESFNKKEFDYIIVDEAHHSASNSYDFVFNYFEPNFLLGLTATPERFDGKDIYEKFSNNVAMNIRLKDALNENLLCPFNYFGVSDLEKIDLSNVDISKVKSYEKKLMIKERVDYIVEKLKFYTNPYKQLKCLAFCASIDHAKYMADEFNKLGIKSINLDGTDNVEFRMNNIEKLRKGEIEVIFCRDIFNEGIDIPDINTILMLRPTESPTIFIQQLGRGLRKFENKDVVTIIDFIGNHKNVYNLAFSFGADFLYDKDAIKNYVKNDFKNFSKFAFFKIDKIAKEEILNKIDSINFESTSWLKNLYANLKKNIGSIPLWLDYSTFESSPDVTKFIKCSKNKSYYSFLKNINDENIEDLDLKEYGMLKTIESFLPLKRNYEYIILKEIFEKGFFDIASFNKNDFINFDDKAFQCSINNLFLKHLDSREKQSYEQVIETNEDKLVFTHDFLKLKNKNSFLKKYIGEIFNFGLHEYYLNTNNDSINKLKLWEKYSRNEALMMLNFEKNYSSFREGFLTINNDYLLMVNLDKTEMVSESHKYKDDFINRFTFQWESQNKTSTESEIGKNIIFHKERNIKLHLFVRKNKSETGNLLPYYYLGEVDVLKHEGSKPIRFILQFKKMVPIEVYESLK